MRFILALLALLPSAGLAQDQQTAKIAEPASPQGAAYDIVAADRETAWRINRVTGEIAVCRIDTTGSLESGPKASCAPAAMQGAAAQQSRAPAGRP